MSQQPVTTTPQTHVLIIGVGTYPHVNGGFYYDAGANSILDGLRQLTSPIVSANALYQKVKDIQQENLWKHPLGSVQLLCSDSTSPAGKPTRKNVKKAYTEWKLHCNANPDNVAIFFFCGHGVEKYDHYLLLEDFGEDPDNVWEGAFDFDSTRRAFHACAAKTQCFFVDACRQLTSEMLTERINALALETPSELTSDCEYSLTIKASAHNEAAHGIPNDVSFFTKGLLSALDCYGFTKKNTEWVIETNTLSSYMDDFIQLVSGGATQRCISVMSRSNTLIRSNEPPEVDVTISCDPDDALGLAHMECENLDSGSKKTRAPKNAPWNLNVKSGIYKISAKFNGSRYQDTTKHADAKPFPKLEEILTCLPK